MAIRNYLQGQTVPIVQNRCKMNAMMTFRVCSLWIGLCLTATPLLEGVADGAGEKTHWATGTTFQRRLNDLVTIRWANIPVRRAIGRLAEVKHVAILLDRRVDPGRKLTLSLRDVTLDAALHDIARRLDLGVARLGNVVYLGPVATAGRLPALAAAFGKDVRRLPPAMQRRFFSTKRLAWDDLARPRDLLAQLARENRLTIEGLDKVPHDLWASADLPPLTLIQRLTLVAVQFDLTFKVAADGRRLSLAPIKTE